MSANMMTDDTFPVPAGQTSMTGTTYGKVTGATYVTGKYGRQIEFTFLTTKGNVIKFWVNITSAKAVQMLIDNGVAIALGEGQASVPKEQPMIYLELRGGRFVWLGKKKKEGN